MSRTKKKTVHETFTEEINKVIFEHNTKELNEELNTNNDIIEEIKPTYHVEFISNLYSFTWGYKKGEQVILDEPTYIIAKSYNSIKDL
jgi:MinD-like ATPase involved in chromosome partitioning or flagellar assembly